MKIFNFKTASDFASASGADGCCTMHMAAIISILITAVIIVDKQKGASRLYAHSVHAKFPSEVLFVK